MVNKDAKGIYSTRKKGISKRKKIFCILLALLALTIIIISTSTLMGMKLGSNKIDLNQSFKKENYIDGVRIIDFFQKNGNCYIDLDDKSIYYGFEFRKDMTISEIEKITKELTFIYKNKFLEDFLKEFEEY